MKDIYLTSTFTNEWNVKFNKTIGKYLETKNISCYLPHRDTEQNKIDKEIFDQDLRGIRHSSILLAIGLNESPNWGAEIGYAFSIKKQILILTTFNHKLPLICEQMSDNIIRVESLDNIESYIDILINQIKKMLANYFVDMNPPKLSNK